MTNIFEIAKQFPELSLTVKARDLIEMVEYCVGRTRAEFEQQITDANTETYPSRQKVAEILDVDLSTLHRWAKRRYLVPIEVGGSRRYRMSDVKRLLEERKIV